MQAAVSDPRRRWLEIRNVLHMTSSAEVLPPEECQGRCDRFVEFIVGKVRSVKQAVSDKVDSLVGGRMDPLFHDHACSRWPGLRRTGTTLNRWRQEDTGVNSRQVFQYGCYSDVAAQVMRGYFCATHRQTGCSFVPWRSLFESVQDRVGNTSPRSPGCMDSEVPGNYIPISNLNNISKIFERLFLRNIIDHASSSPSFNSSQSAYREGHSTETALLRLLNDIYSAADRKSRSLLILLDLSAAVIRRLEQTFGIVGPALSWIKSYLTNRSQFVRGGANRSAEVFCEYGVPQGPVLGPLLFTFYIAPVANEITSHWVSHLQYADDTQLYIALDKDESIEILQNCAGAVYSWFAWTDCHL